MSSVNETIRALEAEVHDEVQSLNQQARSRAFRAVNAMQGAAYDVLGQDGTGRVYRRGAKGVHHLPQIRAIFAATGEDSSSPKGAERACGLFVVSRATCPTHPSLKTARLA